MTNNNPQVTEGRGAYSAIAVTFEDDQNAYNAMTLLKELDAQQRVAVQEAVVVVRGEDGRVVEKDGVGSTALDNTAGGGLLGLLMGIIGGPFGMLIGGTTGLLVGSLFDLNDAEETESALASISSSVRVGRTSLLAVVAEQSPEVVDTAMSGLGGTVVRRPVADIEAEISAAEAAERKAKWEARHELLRAHHEENQAAVHAKVEQLKDKLHVARLTASARPCASSLA
jgi:uncharacterized membrane protein